MFLSLNKVRASTAKVARKYLINKSLYVLLHIVHEVNKDGALVIELKKIDHNIIHLTCMDSAIEDTVILRLVVGSIRISDAIDVNSSELSSRI